MRMVECKLDSEECSLGSKYEIDESTTTFVKLPRLLKRSWHYKVDSKCESDSSSESSEDSNETLETLLELLSRERKCNEHKRNSSTYKLERNGNAKVEKPIAGIVIEWKVNAEGCRSNDNHMPTLWKKVSFKNKVEVMKNAKNESESKKKGKDLGSKILLAI